MNQLSRKDAFFLILLTLFWGLNWPVMKFGVTNLPPLSFRVWALWIALPIIWLIGRIQQRSFRLNKKELISVIRLSLPNVLICQGLMILGVKFLSSGRAAILCYTMPVWAVLIGMIFFQEKLSLRYLVGVAFATAGALLLVVTDSSIFSEATTGAVLTLAAAAVWAYGTIRLKREIIPLHTSILTFWMLFFGTIGMSFFAVVFEFSKWTVPSSLEWAAILYNAIFIFVISATIWNGIARSLPPVASSLSIMMVPVVGLFSSMFMLNELPTWQDYFAMILILVSMAIVLFRKTKPV